MDVDAYASCWAPDAVRLIGPTSTLTEGPAEIREKFRASCARYDAIRVTALLFHSIRLGPGAMALAEISYRFELRRRDTGLPVIEDSREVYSLRRTDAEWLIAANIDHFYEVGHPEVRQ